MKEALIAYSVEPNVINMSDAMGRFCNAINKSSFDDEAEKTLTDAFEQGIITGVATYPNRQSYRLPKSFWRKIGNDTFSMQAFNAIHSAKVVACGDHNNVNKLEQLEGWSVVVEEESFDHWLQSITPKTVTAKQAISWIAFQSFTEAERILHEEPIASADEKWGITDLSLVLEFLKARQANKPLPKSEHYSKKALEALIKRQGVSIDALIHELTKEIEIATDKNNRIKSAEQKFLEALRDQKLVLYGIESGDKSGQKKQVPVDVLRRGQAFINLLDNELRFSHLVRPVENERNTFLPSAWSGLELARDEVMKVWPTIHITNSITTDEVKDNVIKLFVLEHKRQKAGRNEAREWLKSKEYPIAYAEDCIEALPAKNKRPRGRPPKKHLAN